MTPYKNLNANSGVAAYELGDDYILVRFQSGAVYRYSYAIAGKGHVETMKQLAVQGQGLNSYINRYVRKLYDPF